jgi:hypothetical protein
VLLLLAAVSLGACGDDADGPANGATGSATPAGSPTASPDPLIPPLEGPARDTYLGERQDFRDNPDYQLPRPGAVPTPSADSGDPVFDLPATAECWQTLFRGPELFQLCYPPDWEVLTDAYKNSPNEERWYAGGVFKFPDEEGSPQLAHVSVYVIPQFTRPFFYTKECPTPYSIQLNSQAGVVCPSYPANHPEARIVSYHVFREGFDYFFNIALYYEWDAGAGRFTDQTDQQAFDEALQIIRSVEFLPPTTPAPTQ